MARRTGRGGRGETRDEGSLSSSFLRAPRRLAAGFPPRARPLLLAGTLAQCALRCPRARAECVGNGAESDTRRRGLARSRVSVERPNTMSTDPGSVLDRGAHHSTRPSVLVAGGTRRSRGGSVPGPGTQPIPGSSGCVDWRTPCSLCVLVGQEVCVADQRERDSTLSNTVYSPKK